MGMSSRALAQRRQRDGKDVEAVVKVAAELPFATICARSRLVAATSRTFTGMVRVPPRRSNSRSCKRAQQLRLQFQRNVADFVEK